MKRTLVLISVLLSALAAQGGGSDGGGGDNPKPDHGAAWFLGKTRTIRFCTEVSAGFGVSEALLVKDVEGAFAQWNEYLNKRRPQYPITAKATYIGQCRGKAEEDLSFYFGISNKKVEKAKTPFDNPIAFAQKLSYDMRSAWGRGFIWMINSRSSDPKINYPDWSHPDKRYAMLLHEIGHALGNGHVAETIMDGLLASLYVKDDTMSDFLPKIFRNIEWRRELADCLDCTYQGTFLDWPEGGYRRPSQDLAQKVFKLLVGKDAVGKVSALYTAKKGDGFPAYIISDSTGDYKFPIAQQGFDWSPNEAFVFTYARDIFDKEKSKYVPNAQGSIKHTWAINFSLKTNSGQRIPAVLKRNMIDHAVILDAAIDGSMTNIFASRRLDGGPSRVDVTIQDGKKTVTVHPED